jgi:hypothetical protein
MGINQDEDPAPAGNSQSLEPVPLVGVFQVFPLEGFGIGKNGGRFLERDAVPSQIPGGFSSIPGEHICVYTIINRRKSRKLEIVPARFVDFDCHGRYKNF